MILPTAGSLGQASFTAPTTGPPVATDTRSFAEYLAALDDRQDSSSSLHPRAEHVSGPHQQQPADSSNTSPADNRPRADESKASDSSREKKTASSNSVEPESSEPQGEEQAAEAGTQDLQKRPREVEETSEHSRAILTGKAKKTGSGDSDQAESPEWGGRTSVQEKGRTIQTRDDSPGPHGNLDRSFGNSRSGDQKVQPEKDLEIDSSRQDGAESAGAADAMSSADKKLSEQVTAESEAATEQTVASAAASTDKDAQPKEVSSGSDRSDRQIVGEADSENDRSIKKSQASTDRHGGSRPTVEVVDRRTAGQSRENAGQGTEKPDRASKDLAKRVEESGASRRGEGVESLKAIRSESDGNNQPVREIQLDLGGTVGENGDRSGSVQTGARQGQSAASMTHLQKRFQQDLPNDIVRQAKVILKDGDRGEIRLVIRPPELGRVRIQLEMDGGRIAGRILVDNGSVRQVIEQNLGQLQRAFAEHGLELGDLDVQSGDARDQKSSDGETGGGGYGGTRRGGGQEFESQVERISIYETGAQRVNLVA